MEKRHVTTVVVILAVSVLVGCNRTDWRKTPLAPQPSSSPTTGRGTSPQMTVSSKGLILSWLERTDDVTTLKFAERTPSGWTEPVTVVSGDVFVNNADVPSVIRMSDGTLTAHWTKELPDGDEASNLLLSYSKDEGKTWSTPFSPHHDGTITQHAFASLFELPEKGLGLVWLDGRDYEKNDAMSIRYAAYDTNWTQTAETLIDARVCDCCPTSAVATADGMLTAFRDRTDKEIRDISTSRLENGTWTESRTVHDDGWEIDACPVNGPMLSARGTNAVIAWFTTKNEVGQSYGAFSSDSGRTWSDPVRLDDGSSLGRVDVELLEDGTAIATWLEYADKHGQLRVRRFDRSGAKGPSTTVAGATGAVPSGIPRMARVGDELVFAWTEGGPKLKTAAVHIPR